MRSSAQAPVLRVRGCRARCSGFGTFPPDRRACLRAATRRRCALRSASLATDALRSFRRVAPALQPATGPMANQSLPREFFKPPGGACDATQGSWLVGAQARRDRVMAGPFALGAAPITSVAHSWQRCGQPAALQDTTHIAVEARNLSVSMAELVRADGVRGTAVAEVTGDAYGPQSPAVKQCRRLLRTRLRAQ